MDSQARCFRKVIRHNDSTSHWLRPMTIVSVIMFSSAVGVASGQGSWSTARLSVARSNFAAVSIGGVALFAGGFDACAYICKLDELGCACRVGQALVALTARLCSTLRKSRILRIDKLSFTHFLADGGTYYGTVDVFNSASSAWSTAELSVPRALIAATTVGALAIFGGGSPAGVSLHAIERRKYKCLSMFCHVFHCLLL